MSEQLHIGDIVKAKFGKHGERMWFKITAFKGPNVEGTLMNDPVDCPGLHHGDTVAVKHSGIIDKQ